ncbi:MAG: hypothetical protein E7240_10125 [Lachnospiraceae bacterium]|nr:hypothetical protein [Lachnospiraceae bacterium]
MSQEKKEYPAGGEFPYDDILYLDYPGYKAEKTRRKKMSMEERAAQFAPFAALTGYGEAMEETAQEHTGRMNRRE